MRKSSRTSRSSSTHHCNPLSPSIIIAAASSVPFELVRASIPIDPPHPHQPPSQLVPNQDDEAQRFNVGQSQPDGARSVTLTPRQRARGLYREPGSTSRSRSCLHSHHCAIATRVVIGRHGTCRRNRVLVSAPILRPPPSNNNNHNHNHNGQQDCRRHWSQPRHRL